MLLCNRRTIICVSPIFTVQHIVTKLFSVLFFRSNNNRHGPFKSILWHKQ
uniref:Uncharacterized protein n=1 Tax=Anguilla anguilla TaxID=7936 RepID=A0A0E9SXL9_ANGAN